MTTVPMQVQNICAQFQQRREITKINDIRTSLKIPGCDAEYNIFGLEVIRDETE